MIGADPDTNLNASARRQVAVPRSWTALSHTTQEDLMRINKKFAVAAGAAAIVVGGAGGAVAAGGSRAGSNGGPGGALTRGALPPARGAPPARTGGGRGA